ncbi:MAG: SDR family NAD(P)-dependent oxidoreductase [Muribaculaceae bacterium]|nr:SDR family NAD(P)-dependent oxidoreductase [Muribaculaceae bacterium]
MKSIVITGSTSGLGKELVNLFSKSGDWKIFAGYRNEKLIEQIDNVEYFYIDMTDRESIVSAADFIKSKTENLDVVINVAGSVVAGPIEVLDTKKLRHQFEVNTFSHIDFIQNLLPILSGGRIVNISSMASFGHFPFISPYCASKRALDIFFNAFALENHKNIEVVSIKAGVISTPIWKKSVDANLSSLEGCEQYRNELEFLKANALKNTNKGLKVQDAARFVKKAATKKNVKASYTLGKDAKFAQFLSYFPQDIINKLVKFGMKARMMNKYLK